MLLIINQELKKYIEENIFPEYDKNEQAHGIGHIKTVIDRSFELVEENNLDVNLDIVYVVASFHDIGHHIDAKNHEKVSAEIMSKDKNLSKFFSEEELTIIKEAIEDHRSSAKEEPRSIYGKIVSSADRNTSIENSMIRTYIYGSKHCPEMTEEELILRSYNFLSEKFGEEGYAPFYFKDTKYEEFLKEIRKLLKDKDKFIEQEKEYIKKLK